APVAPLVPVAPVAPLGSDPAVPASGIDSGELAAFSDAIMSEALRALEAPACGANLTVTAQVPLIATVRPVQVSTATRKSSALVPAKLTAATRRGAEPLFVIVSV